MRAKGEREASLLANAVDYRGETTIRLFAGWAEGTRTPIGLLSVSDPALAAAVLKKLEAVAEVRDGRTTRGD